MKAQQIFDLTYTLHVLTAAIFVKANGDIVQYFEQYENLNGRGYAFFGIASVLTVLVLIGTAFIYWRRKDIPVLTLLLTCCFVVEDVLVSTGYLGLALFFSIGWFFFDRKPPIFGGHA
ncbi:MAG: hypothetical protein HRT92_06055 [Piscirickettsiaceae bacterium]|nr:hypothetical protein [Piscirickettsiaceae bacterium]